jgi:hypothetical protein
VPPVPTETSDEWFTAAISRGASEPVNVEVLAAAVSGWIIDSYGFGVHYIVLATLCSL